MRGTLLILTILIASVADAATVFKCVGPDGQLTFSQLACSDSLEGERVRIIPSSAGMRLAAPDLEERQPDEDIQSRTLVTGTKSSGSTCGNSTEQDIRTAIVKGEVFPGMTADQAKKAWGEPSEINRSAHGADQWVYYRGDARMDFLYVEDGCLTSWN